MPETDTSGLGFGTGKVYSKWNVAVQGESPVWKDFSLVVDKESKEYQLPTACGLQQLWKYFQACVCVQRVACVQQKLGCVIGHNSYNSSAGHSSFEWIKLNHTTEWAYQCIHGWRNLFQSGRAQGHVQKL